MHGTSDDWADTLSFDAEPGWSMASEEPTGGPARECDLLFVHGMASGRWIWKPDFLAHFRAAGFRVWTLTLPGRISGPTLRTDPAALPRAARAAMAADNAVDALKMLTSVLPGASLFDGPSLDDFADTLDEAAKSIGRPCMIIGHSLGGAVAQNLLRRGGNPHGLALVCSVPPYGMWRASAEMALMNPTLWKALCDFSLFGLSQTDPRVMRENLFPNGVAEHDFGTFVRQLRDESLAATAGAGGFPPFAPLPSPRDNICVIGAARDRLVPPLDVWMTAAWYGQTPIILPQAGHMPMLEGRRDQLAQELIGWITTR